MEACLFYTDGKAYQLSFQVFKGTSLRFEDMVGLRLMFYLMEVKVNSLCAKFQIIRLLHFSRITSLIVKNKPQLKSVQCFSNHS
jgi:hypothetical protein